MLWSLFSFQAIADKDYQTDTQNIRVYYSDFVQAGDNTALELQAVVSTSAFNITELNFVPLSDVEGIHAFEELAMEYYQVISES